MLRSLDLYVGLAYIAVVTTWAVRAYRRREEGGWTQFLVRSIVLTASVWAITGAWLHVSTTQFGSTLSLLNAWSFFLGIAAMAALSGLALASALARIDISRVERPPTP